TFVTTFALACAGSVVLVAAQDKVDYGEIRGDVRDERRDVVVGATVLITGESGFTREVITDDNGVFLIFSLPFGDYTLKVTSKGFAAHEEKLALSAKISSGRVRVTLYPTIREEAAVRAQGSIGVESDRAATTLVLKDRDLQALPDDPDALSQRLQDLASSSGGVPGSAEVTVDGFLTGGRLPPKSAIREVLINPDLYSAEHDKAPYQGGRIEIYTKPGTQSLHGSGFFSFSNWRLNAREAFAATESPMNTRRYGLQFGGPIVRNRVGYLVDFEGRDIDDFAVVNAVVLDQAFNPALFNLSVPTPKRLLVGSVRVDFQVNRFNSAAVRFDTNSNRSANQGVGNFSLPDQATSWRQTEQSLQVVATTIVNTAIFNEARLGFASRTIVQQAALNSPAISVLGAFTSGGSTSQLLRHKENRLQVLDSLSIVNGRHNLKLGLQVYGKHVSDEDRSSYNGAFIFGGTVAPALDSHDKIIIGAQGPVLVSISGLEQYRRAVLALPGGDATSFTITSGNPLVSVNQWTAAGFIQDEWRLSGRLALNLGLRYESQTNPGVANTWAPRLGLAYSPDKKGLWVLRARAGLFYDRLTETLALEDLRFDGAHVSRTLINSASYPDPFENGAVIEVAQLRQTDPTLRPPRAAQFQLGVERQLPGGWKFALFHSWSNGLHVLRSRNINAPLVTDNIDPRLAPRPYGRGQDILQFESGGVTTGRVLFVGINQMTAKTFNIYSGYLLFDFQSDSDGPFSLPQNSYDLSGERARPTFQSRHRAFVITSVNLPYKLTFSSAFNVVSGTPFNITTGRDNNGDGNLNDRPSIAEQISTQLIRTSYGVFDPSVVNGNLGRNAVTNPPTITLDCNISRAFKFGIASKDVDSKYTLTVYGRASNVLNHTNALGLNGVLASPYFGLANAAGPVRRIELGLRFAL
ncbi:MAG TPA: TonB-dependent receptor, partial [Blastocatellia bacterium]|nr:TonB-dependent receptor [Blastocatellia bacterium]